MKIRHDHSVLHIYTSHSLGYSGFCRTVNMNRMDTVVDSFRHAGEGLGCHALEEPNFAPPLPCFALRNPSARIAETLNGNPSNGT